MELLPLRSDGGCCARCCRRSKSVRWRWRAMESATKIEENHLERSEVERSEVERSEVERSLRFENEF